MMNSYEDLIYKIFTFGMKSKPRDLEIYELLNQHISVTNNNILLNCKGYRDITDPTTPEGKYLRAEFVWYLSGDLDPFYINNFAKLWNNIRNPELDNDSKNFNTITIDAATKRELNNFSSLVNSNYGYHVFYKPVLESSLFYIIDYKDFYYVKESYNKSPFNYIIKTLEKDKDSRQALIQYTLPNIYYDKVKDFTCTQNQHFLIRGNQLRNIVNIRSSDAIKGLTFDIPWWDFVGQCVARITNSIYGQLDINIGSAHFYENDKKIITNLIDNGAKFNKMILKNNSSLHKNLIAFNDLVNSYIVNTFGLTYFNLPDGYVSIKHNNSMFVLLSKIEKHIYSIDSFEDILKTYIMLINILVYTIRDNPEALNKEMLTDINNTVFDCFFDIH